MEELTLQELIQKRKEIDEQIKMMRNAVSQCGDLFYEVHPRKKYRDSRSLKLNVVSGITSSKKLIFEANDDASIVKYLRRLAEDANRLADSISQSAQKSKEYIK